MSKPWLIAGDFNETRSLAQRDHGFNHMARHCFRFNNWMVNNGFLDLGFSGPQFTWTFGSTPKSRKCARLDRALCNLDRRERLGGGCATSVTSPIEPLSAPY